MKFKKAIIILLCAVMSLSMLACGGIDMPDSGTGTPNGVVTNGKTYTITFDADADGVANPDPIQVGEGKTMGDLMPKPTRPGYDLKGWFNGEKEYTKTTKITADVVLTAKWESNAAKLEYEKNVSSWAKPGHLYIHYKRFNHDAKEQTAPPANGVAAGNPEYNTAINSAVYGDWGLWAWPKSNANGRLFNAAWIDESGAVFDVLLDHTYNDCGWDGKKKVPQNVPNTYKDAAEVGVQICQLSTRTDPAASFWANDGGDNFLTMSKYAREKGDYHWFINEAHVKDGSPTFTSVEYVDPYKDDPNRTLNATKTSGTNIITNSAADNSGLYPVKSVSNFNCSNGYQIFIASFADSDGDGMGDIQGIIDKLGYLESLNIDLLWLTPFQDSTDYHGYNINSYDTVDSRWGTKEKYRELISKAKEKGMKIVMDFVLNHTSLSNEWFIKSETLVKEKNVTFADKTYDEVDYRQFYTWITKAQYNAIVASDKANGRTGDNAWASHWYKDNYDYYFYSSFSASQPELNFDYQPVRDAILDVCYGWMKEGLAGFRLDAVKHIYMCNEVKGKTSSVNYTKEFTTATGSGNNLKADYDHVADKDTRFNYDIKRNLNFYREFNNRLKTKYPNAFVVGENLDGWDQRIAPFYQGIDSQFDFALYYNIPRGIVKESGVPASKFGDNLAAIYNRYDRGRKAYKQFNSGYVGGQFTSNHDLPRARDRVNVTDINEDADTFDSFYTTKTIDGKAHNYDDAIHNSIPAGTVVESKVTKSTAMLKLYYAALMTLPGVTWIYYGDEIGMSGLMQHTLACKKEYQNLQTSSTASDPHEDIIYRQPMKWNKATAAEYNDTNKTSHGNAAFKMGYGDKLCELVGINATDYVPSVAESTNPDGSFKPGSLLEWTAKLTKMRKDKGITGSSTLTVNASNTGTAKNCSEYTVTGSKGSITVKFGKGSPSGSAYNGLSFSYGGMYVIITG